MFIFGVGLASGESCRGVIQWKFSTNMMSLLMGLVGCTKSGGDPAKWEARNIIIYLVQPTTWVMSWVAS
jgi:hypothetical protein